jgi:electron transfer flavoprotein alpha subunit
MCEHERQIGQTGTTFAPNCIFLRNFRTIQHIAGMQESAMIIAINTIHTLRSTPLPIMNYGTVEEVIPKMIQYYKKNSK